jgi:hypothetical protein
MRTPFNPSLFVLAAALGAGACAASIHEGTALRVEDTCVARAPATMQASARPNLGVVVEPDPPGGTMHAALSAQFSVEGAAPLRVITDYEHDELVPLFDTQFTLDRKHWVVIGWSSWGGGMHTHSAWLLTKRDARLVIADRMEFTGSRAASLLVIATDGGRLRLGVSQPPNEASNPEDWSLRLGERSLDLDAIRHLPFTTTVPGGARGYAPFESDQTHGRVAWYAPVGDRFCPFPNANP